MEFKEATPQERRIFYSEEWNSKNVPDFITGSMQEREFAFDHNGSGYNDRYNAFNDLRELDTKIRALNPYAVCASTAYYKAPERREGWMKAELVFDIDAKDQPVRTCSCEVGEICERCLEESKQLALTIIDTLRDDLGQHETLLAYSGRGYHIHVLDEKAQLIENRSAILEYVMGSKMPMDIQMINGYAKTWRKMFSLTLSKAKESDLSFMNRNIAKVVIENREKIIDGLNRRDSDFLDIPGIGKASKDKLIEGIMGLSGQTVDGKVTIDTKRILRLPTTLHSKISMICTLVKDPESFDPFRDAVPGFVNERND
ncbi:MAG TPA: DNA primase catalytic subunit PriS [Candidatus Methanofastidiosa archaeon]|nr:DNA primase catalytic subunit PriS [Candidatus Methanofastidiosa archaeon]HPR42683.1 DNA primase catalytic subunit PriS [Candidatus Methanofastidiosa archaeon]